MYLGACASDINDRHLGGSQPRMEKILAMAKKAERGGGGGVMDGLTGLQ